MFQVYCQHYAFWRFVHLGISQLAHSNRNFDDHCQNYSYHKASPVSERLCPQFCPQCLATSPAVARFTHTVAVCSPSMLNQEPTVQ